MSSSAAQYDRLGQYYEWAWGSSDGRKDKDYGLYLCLARQHGNSVLEMGSGTGRLCIPLAAEGVNVNGIELSKSMLAIAKRKAEKVLKQSQRRSLRMVNGDMCEIKQAGTFGLVIFPYSSLMEVGSIDRVKAALALGYSMLAKTGALVVDSFFYGPGAPERPNGVLRMLHRMPRPGGMTLQFSETDFLDEKKGITERWLYADQYDKMGIVRERRFFPIRRVYVGPDQMRKLLMAVGFKRRDTKLFGAFDQQTQIDDKSFLNADNPNFLKARQVWICRK